MDDLADGGPALLTTTYLVGNEIFQAFGTPEVLQLTGDGQLWCRYWSNWRFPALENWATNAGVDVTDATLPPG
jgi:hypothetical protein